MANPFERKFDGQCDRCGDHLLEGDMTYAHEDEFMCYSCADELNIVCGCDEKKKPEYDECYDCHQGG